MSIAQKLENAFTDWLTSAIAAPYDALLTPYAVRPALVTTEQPNSRIVVHCPAGEPIAPTVNLYEINLMIIMADQMDERTPAQHSAASQKLAELICNPDGPALAAMNKPASPAIDLRTTTGVTISGFTPIGIQRDIAEETSSYLTTFSLVVTASLGDPS